MRDVSDLFGPALRESHRLAVEAWVTGPYLSTPVNLPVTGGSVTVDGTNPVRGRCDLEIADASLFPHHYQDALAPYGSEVLVRRGIRYPNGVAEMVPLGLFRVEEVALDAAAGTIHVAGSDRMAQLADERFTSPYAPARYSRHVDVIEDLVHAVYPNAPVETPAIATTVGAPVFEEDRVAAIFELATAIGCTAYWDGTGRFVVVPIPPAEADSYVWVADASPVGVLVDATRRLTREGAYNGVVARGQDTAAGNVGVQALVVDNRTDSPTRWGGPFGHVPRFYSSPLITTAAQATSAATALLAQATGLADATDATCIPNPAIEPGDPVLVVWPDGTSAIHLVESFTVPLSADGTMTLTSKRAAALPATLSAPERAPDAPERAA